jgi:signal transduction histidine kinase
MAINGSARMQVQRAVVSRRSQPGDTSVAGHRRGGGTRPNQLRSVRAQLLAPIIVAMIGLAVLGTAQTSSAASAAQDARRARTLATTATSTVRFVHEVDGELAETAALRQRGGKAGLPLVTAQRQRADDAFTAYHRDSQAALRVAPDLSGPVSAAETMLAQLAAIRESATNPTTGPTTDAIYRKISESLLAVADALPAQIADISLANQARAVASIASVEHFAAVERDQVRAMFARGTVQPGDLTTLAQVVGAREQREAEFTRVSTTEEEQIYTDQLRGTDVDNATKDLNGVLAADQDPSGLKVDADAWYTAQSNVVRHVDIVGLSLSNRLDDAAAKVSRDAVRRAWGTGIGTALIGLLALATAIVLAVRIARRLRDLRGAALTVARRDLPEAINSVITGQLPTPATEADGRSAAAVTRSIASTNDEIGQVADAFATVHRTALRLAGEQAELRVDVGRMAEVLARRIRTLITRQLRLLDEFERDETDPDVLARLFALDHIAARLRRNGENLLVLAGGEPGRPASGAVPLTAVITAAASEIEDFHRVEAGPSDVHVAGPVVGDVVHLLAELLENAATFSPPSNPVQVDARPTVDGALVRVHDAGIGINERKLAEINARLARPTALSSAAAGTMGLYVVAHLAARHGIRVQLAATGSGTTALVQLPHRVLALPSALPAGSRSGAAPDEPVMVGSVVGAPVSGGPGDMSFASAAMRARSRPGAPVASPAGQAPWFRPYLSGGGSTPFVPPSAPVSPVPGAWPTRPTESAGDPAPPAGVPMPAVPAPRKPYESLSPSSNQNGTVYGEPSLPRRRPGHQLTPPTPRPSVADEPTVTVPVDPETVRARLSAFSEGVAAALRRSNEATPAQKDR